MIKRYAILAFAGMALVAGPAVAELCPKAGIVRTAIKIQDRKTGIDDDPIGGGISSDPEWKAAKNVAGAYDIFGDGSTYITLRGVMIGQTGALSCAYGFSEVSGLGFVTERGLTGSYISRKIGTCRPNAPKMWKQKTIGGRKNRNSVWLCNPAETACEFSCR
jgi:hypothetical protein